MEEDSPQEPRSPKDSNGSIKPQADEIALQSGPSGTYSSAPPHTVTRMGASSTKQFFSSSVNLPHRDQQQQARTGTTGIALAISPLSFYSENIPLLKEEDAGNHDWIWFVTLVERKGGGYMHRLLTPDGRERKGGEYRHRALTPDGRGGFSDVWKCDCRLSDGSNMVVAVKKLRVGKLPSGSSESKVKKKLLKRLKKELRIWMRLQHPNIAPVLGFCLEEEIAIISPWFDRGNLADYLDHCPEPNRMKLVQGVAAGLAYLHLSSPIIVHGDMKPDNVLIDQWGCARIIDFGLSKMVEEDPSLSSLTATSPRDAGNARWMAPELLSDESAHRSPKTDMYSFGCLAFFILIGDMPFKGTPDRLIATSQLRGVSPIRKYPDLNIENTSMEVLRACCMREPGNRSKIEEVMRCLNAAHPIQKCKWASLKTFLRKICI